MRITGGILRGRTFDVPGGGVRPTKDQVREAIFSSVAEVVPGARVLDLFAGSGALGLEAASRGAAYVEWIESNRSVFRTLEANVGKLCKELDAECVCTSMDVYSVLKRGWGGDTFDLILADAPYAATRDQGLFQKTLNALMEGRILSPAGILVFEQRVDADYEEVQGWKLLRDKRYGDTRVLILKQVLE